MRAVVPQMALFWLITRCGCEKKWLQEVKGSPYPEWRVPLAISLWPHLMGGGDDFTPEPGVQYRRFKLYREWWDPKAEIRVFEYHEAEE